MNEVLEASYFHHNLTSSHFSNGSSNGKGANFFNAKEEDNEDVELTDKNEAAKDVAAKQSLHFFYIQSSLLILVTSLTVVGNLIIIACVKTQRNLQRPSHIFVASLAFTDLCLGLAVMVPRLLKEILGGWYFGYFLCQCYHAMDVTLCTNSILHLCCISVDRYYAIVNQPLLYYDRVTGTKVAVSICICWIISAMIGFLPVFTGIYSLEQHLLTSKESSAIVCDLVVNKCFSIVAGLVSFWLPASVIIYVYTMVYLETRRLAQQGRVRIMLVDPVAVSDKRATTDDQQDCGDKVIINLEQGQGGDLGSGGCNDKEVQIGGDRGPPRGRRPPDQGGFSYESQSDLLRDMESSAARTFGIVVGLFLMCWLPFFIWMPLTSLWELETPPSLYSVILWVGYGNSAVNPIIYGIFNREFRAVMVRAIGKLAFAWPLV